MLNYAAEPNIKNKIKIKPKFVFLFLAKRLWSKCKTIWAGFTVNVSHTHTHKQIFNKYIYFEIVTYPFVNILIIKKGDFW